MDLIEKIILICFNQMFSQRAYFVQIKWQVRKLQKVTMCPFFLMILL